MTVKRTLPANVLAVIDDQHTEPFHIVKIEFANATKYLSETQEVVFEGNTYVEGAIQVGSFRWGPDGTQSGAIRLLNENNAASALVLNDKVDDVVVTIYKVYSTGPATNTDPVVYVVGVLDGSALSPKEAVLKVVTSKADTEFVPNEFYTIEEGFNHLPPSGTVVQWANEKYVLQGLETA